MPAATETALCVNPDCARPFAAAARFCPFCATPRLTEEGPVPGWDGAGTDQPQTGPDGGAQGAGRRAYRYSSGATGSGRDDTGMVVLRAGESVWHAEEDEGEPPPGARRPLLVVDEQVTHLAHTDRRLSPEELLDRVRGLLDRDGVPIDVALRQARWLSDGAEARPRLIASLRGHRYSDVKMLLGVDYLGRWASIHLGLAVEPEPLPVPPAPEKEPPPPPYRAPAPLLWMLGIGLLAAFGGGQEEANASSWFGPDRLIWMLVCGAGVVAILVAGFSLIVSASNHGNRCAAQRQAWETEQRRRAWEWEQQQKRRRDQRTAERLSRTFKVDDMRLFSTAMREVFQGVVDDIVSQGAQVARIEGGNGGFFRGGPDGGGGANAGVASAAPAPRRSDAAEAGV